MRSIPARKAAATAGALLVGAASSDQQSHAELAAFPPRGEALELSRALLHHTLDEGSKQQLDRALVSLGESEDGQQWVDVAHDLLDLGAAVASDPTVQRAVHEKLSSFPWMRDLALSESPGLTLTPSDEEEKLSVSSDFATVSHHFDELCADMEKLKAKCSSLEEENARLRAQVEPGRSKYMPHVAHPDYRALMPHHFLFQPRAASSRPAVARVQALARGALSRQGFYELQRWAASRVEVRLEPQLGADGKPHVKLHLTPTHAAKRKPLKTRAQKELPRQALIIAAAIVVGALALIVSRNPRAASAAAAGAAATIMNLLKPKGARNCA